MSRCCQLHEFILFACIAIAQPSRGQCPRTCFHIGLAQFFQTRGVSDVCIKFPRIRGVS